jgi:hypothetical protein
MKKLGINDSRFQHRYITAQAYVLLLKDHIVDVGSSSLHETYVTYSKAKPPASTTEEMRKTLKFLDEHLGEDANMITTSADFISIFLLAKHLMSSYAIEKTMNLKNFLTQFLIKVAYVTSSENEEDAPYFDYQIYRRSSADSRRSIENRFNVILSKFLEANPTLIPKDPVRSFDDWEKLAVYWRDKGICQLQISPDCKKKIPLNEGTVDHKNPHSKGGKTIINNGQWSCVPCNLKKQNKQNSGTK